MDNMVYIPVCRGWSINGAAQWDVVAVPTNKAEGVLNLKMIS